MQSDFGLDRILSTLIVGAVGGYITQLWKYGKDAYHARVDEACELIFHTADQCAEYWMTAKTSETQERLNLAEVKIDGSMKKLQFLRLMLQPSFEEDSREKLVELMSGFEIAATGGAFATQQREADAQRAREVYVAASDLVACVRSAADHSNRFSVTVGRHAKRCFQFWRWKTETLVFWCSLLLVSIIGFAIALFWIERPLAGN